MANVNAPNGFRPVAHLTGGRINVEEYTIASAYGTAIGYGDPVEELGTGRTIGRAAAGNTDNLGIFVGCEYTDANGNHAFHRNWVASTTATNIRALVITDPNVIFEAQADSCAAADEGSLCDWVIGAPDANGNSTSYAQGSAVATTGKSLKILYKAPIEGNEYGNYCRVRVKFVEHVHQASVSGVGGV